MLRKTFQLLINNPSIIILQMVYIVSLFLNSFLFYSIKLSEISSNIEYFLGAKFIFSTVLGLLLGVVFISGFGNAFTKAITSSKCDFKAFFVGIKKYFMKSMLSTLVLYIIYVVFSSILFPAAAQIIVDIFIPYGDLRKVFYYICIYIISIFVMPFTTLFLPAVFIDHYDIVAGLITGMKLAVRNYKKLVWVLFFMYIPIIINIFYIKDAVIFIFTPLSIEYILNPIDVISGKVFSVSVIIMYLLEAAIFIVSAPLYFVIYKESSSKRLLY